MKAFPLLSRATPLWAVMLLAALLTGCQGINTTGTTRAPDVIDIGEPDVTVEQPGPRDDQPTADQARVPREIPFPEDVYAKLPKSGSAVLSGRLTLNTDAGPVIGANETVSLAPITKYSAEAAAQALAGRAVERADPRAREYTHTTRTDGNGYFQLRDLPPGDFYASGTVVDPATGMRQIVIKEVSLSNGGHSELQLSR
ncbi:carboxypeptidase-like regulatory domain-containing protein [Halomonas cupida]|uniref:carboxypeptidase-like regulatory domain-containing protein n=1 Tax=Halomonas cupida TaxID=44933 RepID=UPI002EA1FFD7|nr:carboxypeptidase-like regulatory domain-containing protein [Pseudomonadota bacterium]